MNFLQTTLPFIDEIRFNFDSVLQILAPDNKVPKYLARRSRGLINAVGRLEKVLFGVCYDEDAEFFYNNIINLNQANEKSLHLAQDQLRIVSAVVQDVNITTRDLLETSDKLQKNIEFLFKQTQLLLEAINILEVKSRFHEHTTLLGILLNQFAWETQNLQTIDDYALNGIMNTSVYSPAELYLELKEIQLTLPPTLELPTTVSHLAVPELFRVSSLSVVYVRQTLIFVTRIPLLSNIPFNLYHSIPLPLAIGNNIMLINPDAQYLAVSVNHEYHISLTETQINNCKSLFSFKLCVGLEYISKRTETETCEVSLYYDPDSSLDVCYLKYLNTNSTIWHKLINQNAWLYYCTKQDITIACNQESFKISLTGVGKIEIPEYCVVYTES